jgi:hypothetical protein
MSEQPVLRSPRLIDLVDTIIERITQKYPDTYCLMSDEVYGDEDVDLEIYVPEEKVLEVDQFAHEVAFELTNGTGILILPMVVSKEYCSVKQ